MPPSPTAGRRAKRKLVRREAVVFVVDAASSMNRPFPAAADPSPRLQDAETRRTEATAQHRIPSSSFSPVKVAVVGSQLSKSGVGAAAATDDDHSGQATLSSPPPPDSSWRPTTPSTTTYLDAAKRAVIGKLTDLAASQRNETNVIVCGHSPTKSADDNDNDGRDRTAMSSSRTSRFRHPSITDIGTVLQSETDLNPVTVPLLHRVKAIQAPRWSGNDENEYEDASRDRRPPPTPRGGGDGGNLLRALVQGGEVLQSALADRTYEQAAVCVVSDFRRTLEWPKQDMGRIEQLVDVLQTMQCRINVVWMEDKSEVNGGASAGDGGSDEVEDGTPQPTAQRDARVDPTGQGGSRVGDGGGDSDDNDESDCNNHDDMYQWINRTDKDQFLRGIVEATGGDMVVASTVQQVLAAVRRMKMLQKATKKKLKLEMVSDLVVNVHQSALFVKKSLPTIKKDKVVLVDEEGKPMLEEGTQEPLADLFYKETMLTDGEDVVEPDDVAKAVSYGNDLVTMSDWDYVALKADDCYESRLQVLGFLEESLVPQTYLKGPPKVISGNDGGTESEAMVPALAQALLALKEVGICTVSSQTSASGRHPPPILGALYPYRGDAQSSLPNSLLFLQLPFAGEVKQLQFSLDYDAVVEQHARVGSQARSSDDLVDSMMLPSDVLSNVTTPNPAIRSWDQAVVQRFLDPTMNATALLSPFPLELPKGTLELAKQPLDVFWSTFQLPTIQPKRKDEQDGKGKRKKGKLSLFYKDFL